MWWKEFVALVSVGRCSILQSKCKNELLISASLKKISHTIKILFGHMATNRTNFDILPPDENVDEARERLKQASLGEQSISSNKDQSEMSLLDILSLFVANRFESSVGSKSVCLFR